MRPAGKRRRKFRFKKAAIRDAHINEFVETIIKKNMRVEQIDRERTEEHLEHIFAEIEIDGTLSLRIGTCEIKYRDIAFAPKLTSDLVRPLANTIVADIVLEVLRLFRNDHVDDCTHRFKISIKHDLHGCKKCVVAESLSNLDTAPARRPARSNQRIEVEAVPLGRPHVMQDQLEQITLQLAFLVELSRRYSNTFLENCLGAYRN